MLSEAIPHVQHNAVTEPNGSLVFENMLSEWGELPYAELSVLLVHLRWLALVHQAHHWTSKGDPFYGDHLLFERLYNTASEEIDAIGERSVGLGTDQNVNLMLHLSQLQRLAQDYGVLSTLPHPTELAQRSLLAEQVFMKTMGYVIVSLKESQQLTQGLENLLQDICDNHESSTYLLKQRCK